MYFVRQQMIKMSGCGYIIYKNIWLNVWLLRKLFVILHRFFAPIGPKMTSKCLIACDVKWSKKAEKQTEK